MAGHMQLEQSATRAQDPFQNKTLTLPLNYYSFFIKYDIERKSE
jgi:hypothetical protein